MNLFKLNQINKKNMMIFSLLFIFSLLCSNSFALSKAAANARQKRFDFVNSAKKYIGAPYEYGASGPKSFDCSGFVCFLAKKNFNKTLPRRAADMYKACEKVSKKKIEIGDLVFFEHDKSSGISHVGIYIGKYKFISALNSGSRKGVQISSINGKYWKSKFCAVGRILPSGL